MFPRPGSDPPIYEGCVFLVEDIRVIALHDLVGKLRNLFQSVFNRFFTHHSIDRKNFPTSERKPIKLTVIVVIDHFGFIVPFSNRGNETIADRANPFLYSFAFLFGDYVQHLWRTDANETSHTANLSAWVCGLLVEGDGSSRWQPSDQIEELSAWIANRYNRKPDLLPVLCNKTFASVVWNTKPRSFSSSKNVHIITLLYKFIHFSILP